MRRRSHAVYNHPVNVLHIHEAGFGDRLADRIAATIGSWHFLIVQTVLVIAWICANIAMVAFRWDPPPFVLLNLMFSVQAAYTGPVLLLAGNRQAAIDRALAEHDLGVTQDADELIKRVLEQLTRVLEELTKNSEATLAILKRVESSAPLGATGGDG